MPDQPKITGTRFPCQQCGAALVYSPGERLLICPHCGHENQIEEDPQPITEYDFHQALEIIAKTPDQKPPPQIQCTACGASFQFKESLHAGHCPFCDSPVIIEPEALRPISPKSLLPFKIGQKEARQYFRHWLKSLWFAPSSLKKFAREEGQLAGLYLPFWTYDSHTKTTYSGARGIIYYETREITVIENGRPVRRLQQVQKIRWYPVSGMVSRFFDDVLIGASRTLPRQILDRISPWDLENLVPFDPRYLSGFESEVYQVQLDEGFDQARRIMDQIIDQDIRFDIGGDLQQIHHKRTRHSHTTYKHCLLPVWIAAYHYRGRRYRVIINARSGRVAGGRPYSVWKIVATVVFMLTLVLGGGYVLKKSGILDQPQSGAIIQTPYPELAK